MKGKALSVILTDTSFVRLLYVCTPILFVLKIILHFSLDEPYKQFFDLSFDPSAYPGDLIRSCGIREQSVFWPAMAFLAPLGSLIGQVPTVFVVYVLVAFAILIVVYRIGLLLSSHDVSLLFVFFVLVGSHLLPGASVFVVYPHAFSQTPVGYLCGLAVIYFYLSGRYLSCMATLTLALAVHVKTVFGFACPLGLLILWECFDKSFSEKKQLIKSCVLASPFLLVVGGIFFALSQDVASMPELATATAIRQGGETNPLELWGSQYEHYFRYVEYILVQTAAVMVYKKYGPQGGPASRAYKLLLLGNACLLLGMAVSALVSLGLLSPAPWLFFAWTKNAILPCLFALFFIAHFLATTLPLRTVTGHDSAWGAVLVVTGIFLLYLILFGCDLFVDGQPRKLVGFAFILAIAAFTVSRFLTRENVNFAVIGTFVAGLLFYTSYVLVKERAGMGQYPGYSFSFVPPQQDHNDYTAGRWLRNNSEADAFCLFPVVNGQQFDYYSMRTFSGRPFFYTSNMVDVYGSRKGYLEWKHRKAVLTSWETTGNSLTLLAQKIRYVIVRKSDLAKLPTQTFTSVFENERLKVLRVPDQWNPAATTEAGRTICSR